MFSFKCKTHEKLILTKKKMYFLYITLKNLGSFIQALK